MIEKRIAQMGAHALLVARNNHRNIGAPYRPGGLYFANTIAKSVVLFQWVSKPEQGDLPVTFP